MKDAASETTSISRASSYQKLNGKEENPPPPDKDVEEAERSKELNSLSHASFNFINSIIGAGVIGMYINSCI